MADSLLGGIIINEILVDPNGASDFDTDGNGTANATDEFIEIYNSSGSAIDISGLELWDAGVGQWFTFPPGTILQPGGHAVVITEVQADGSLPTGGPDDLFFDAGRGSAVINNGGDNIVLYDPTNDEYIAAQFNGDAPDDPTLGVGGYAGFSPTATQSGSGEDFGSDSDGQSIQRSPDGGDGFITGTPTPGGGNICFTGGTLFDTPDGPRPIEALRTGDMITTRDNGPQRISWIWSRTRSAAEIAANPRMRPVRIRRSALGAGLPRHDLRLSQQHRIMVASRIAQRVFGAQEVLVAVKDLLGLPGVDIDDDLVPVTYYHILLDRHEVLSANGLPSESLYLGPQALRMLAPEAMSELTELLGPEIVGELPRPARTLARGRKAAKMVKRHVKNAKPMLDAG